MPLLAQPPHAPGRTRALLSQNGRENMALRDHLVATKEGVEERARGMQTLLQRLLVLAGLAQHVVQLAHGARMVRLALSVPRPRMSV
jgi:hypothetical protein